MGGGADLNELRERASAVLGGVHLAAQWHPYPFYPTPAQPRLQQAAIDLGHQLADALFSHEWLIIDCNTLQEHPVAQPKRVATLHGGRLLVTQTARISKLPHTGRRIDRHLITDLKLLAWEARKGVTRRCPQCGQPHQLKLATLKGARTHRIVSRPLEKAPSPKAYPDIEDAAFAEILGPLDQGIPALDQLKIGMPPRREAHYRNIWAHNPTVLNHQELISNRKDLIIQDDVHEPDGYRQTNLPFPIRPDHLPADLRLREHKPDTQTPD